MAAEEKEGGKYDNYDSCSGYEGDRRPYRYPAKAAGMSVSDVQDILGLGSVQAIYKWIAGKSLPTIDNLIILSAIWDVSLDDIIVRC